MRSLVSSLLALAPIKRFYVIMENTIFDEVKCKLKMGLVALKQLWDTFCVSAPSNRTDISLLT